MRKVAGIPSWISRASGYRELAVHDRSQDRHARDRAQFAAVLTAEEAMPEFAAGRLESAVALTGTMTMPKPMPASPHRPTQRRHADVAVDRGVGEDHAQAGERDSRSVIGTRDPTGRPNDR